MKPTSTVDRLLDRIQALKHTCDLDLLLFFLRHPRALLTGEDLAALVGCKLAEITQSLESLIGSGLVERSPNRTNGARMYRLIADGSAGGLLATLRQMSATGEGRAALVTALRARRSASGPTTRDLRHHASRKAVACA